MVAGGGFEPPTFGLWAQRATKLLYPATFLLLAGVVYYTQKFKIFPTILKIFSNAPVQVF